MNISIVFAYILDACDDGMFDVEIILHLLNKMNMYMSKYLEIACCVLFIFSGLGTGPLKTHKIIARVIQKQQKQKQNNRCCLQ